MASTDPLPEPRSLTTYVEDGVYIAAILLTWGVLSLFATYMLAEIGGTGSLFAMLGPWLGDILVQVGLLNAGVYVVYRAIDYWQA